MVRIVQILIEHTTCGLFAGIAYVWRLRFDRARIVHKVRASAVAGYALSAGYLAFMDPLLSAYVSLTARVPELTTVRPITLIVLRFIIPVISDLL